MKSSYIKPYLLILFVLSADQILKIWIKLNMTLSQEYSIFGNWFLIHFTENNGMAFGLELGGFTGKLILTIFRIIAVGCIGYALHFLIKKKYHQGLIFGIALILAGAIGNIIDSVFYSALFSETTYYTPAKLVPFLHGYAPLFHGKVVDMLYFPLLKGTFPQWVPFWAGQEFIFFRPIFNLADTAISIGVVTLLIFQKYYYQVIEKDADYLNSEVVEE